MVWTQVVIGHVVPQHVVDADQQTVRYRQPRPWLAASPREAMIERMRVRAGRAGNTGCELAQDGLEVGVAFPGRATQVFARAALVPRAHSGPRCQMGGTGKARHV